MERSLYFYLFSKKKILLSDEELVLKYTHTLENKYVAELYSRYATLAYGASMKYLKNPDLAKDATMDIFERLIKDLPRYQVANFKSWLYIVVKNHCLQVLKSQQSNVSSEELLKADEDGNMELGSDSYLTDVDKEETLLALEKAMDQLENSQKECIKLFYLEKKSYSEITAETGYSFNEVKSFIQNGKRNLKIKLTKIITTMVVIIIAFYK